MPELPTVVYSPYPCGGRSPEYFPSVTVSSGPAPPAPMPPAAETEDAVRRALQRRIADDAWQEAVLELCQRSSESLLITSVVNQVARLDAYRTWPEFEQRKLMLFRLIGLMIRQGRLERVSRRNVTIPRGDGKWQAYVSSLTKPLKLPPPRIG